MEVCFKTWMSKMKAKMRAERYQFPTDDDRITHVASLIKGDAADLIAPRLDLDSSKYSKNVDELYAHLTTLYEDVNKKRKARSEYQRLFMKNEQNFQEFYTKLLRLTVDAETPEDDLKEDLNEKLQIDLQVAVLTYFNSNNIDVEEFARWCTTIDQQIKQRQAKLARFGKNMTISTGSPQRASPTLTNTINLTTPAAFAHTAQTKNVPVLYTTNRRARVE